MLKNEILSLPDNWEAIMEQSMLKKPIGHRYENVYICSPCRADTPDGVVQNMKAARMYMFYAYQHLLGIPKAPHAYLPVLLNDSYEGERALALQFGKQLLNVCDRMFVCGNKLSEGMYGEIVAAVELGISIEVFNRNVCDELRERLLQEKIDPMCVQHEDNHLHFALALGADELAPYWEETDT